MTFKLPGRNQYKKICFKCGEMVPAHEGYLKKYGAEYFVHHEKECNPSFDMEAFKKNPQQPKSSKVRSRSNKEKLLEEKIKTKSSSSKTLVASTPKYKVIDEPQEDIDPHVLDFLEAELMKRKTMGLPVIMLPKVIAYIKKLKETIEKLSPGEIV